MKYDYSFLTNHASKKRKFRGNNGSIYGLLGQFYRSYEDVEEKINTQLVGEFQWEFEAKGLYTKGGESTQPLEESLNTDLPEDFKQFYEQFGESVIITRTRPIWITPLKTMVEAFEDDPDIEVFQGRFFRFAEYSDSDPLYLGLRKNDITDAWEVVLCTYGLLYSEMIGPEGRDSVVADSFYSWIKNLVETDGIPDEIYPFDPEANYLEVLGEVEET